MENINPAKLVDYTVLSRLYMSHWKTCLKVSISSPFADISTPLHKHTVVAPSSLHMRLCNIGGVRIDEMSESGVLGIWYSFFQ